MARTIAAAIAQIRIEIRNRSMMIATKTSPFMTKARSVGIAAPDIRRYQASTKRVAPAAIFLFC
jgi:hypothetical protein